MTLRPRATRRAAQILLAFLAAATLVAGTPEPPPGHPPLDAATRSQLLEEIAKSLETMYVDPEAGRRMAAEVRRRSADRGYDEMQTIPEFASRMTRGSNDPRRPADNVAIGYTRQLGAGGPGKARQRNTEILPGRSSSAGGSYSTAADLLRLDIALRDDKLLPPEFGDWLFSDKQRAPGQRGSRSGRLGVAGGLPGGNATLEMDLDRGYTVIVLSNDDPPSAEKVARKIREWIGI